MREHPAIKIGRDLALVEHIAAGGVVAGWFVLGCAHDLVVSEDEFAFVSPWDFLLSHLGIGTVGADDAAGTHRLWRALALGLGWACKVVDHRRAVRLAADVRESAGATLGTGAGRALAQPFVEFVAVDHADKAVVDRNVDPVVGRRDHAGAFGLGHQQLIGDVEVANQARRDGAAARLDAAGAVEQQHAVAAPCQLLRGRSTGGAAADDHRLVDVLGVHGLPFSVVGVAGLSFVGHLQRRCSGRRRRVAAAVDDRVDPDLPGQGGRDQEHQAL